MSCEELDKKQKEAAFGPVFQSPGGQEEFVNRYVDAYYACNSERLGFGTLTAEVVVKLIEEQLGVFGVTLPNNTQEAIIASVVQSKERKRATANTGKSTTKDHTAAIGADPVMLFNGQFVHDVDDIYIKGAGIDFVFKRMYKNQVIFNGPLGYNWTHNFHIWLRVGDQVIFRSTGDLREEPFTRHPLFDENNLVNGEFDYWMPPDGKHGVIFAENSSFVLRQPDGSRQIFEPDPGHSFLHRLSLIEDRFGNYLRLHYDEDQRLTNIEINHLQRLVAFDYDAEDRICSIRDYFDRKWSYTYDSHGDLITVTSPSTDRYDCGLTVSYDYSSAFHSGDLQHNLVRIIDAAGQIYLETEYGTSSGLLNFNRVVRQRQGGGEYLFEYEDIDQIFDFDYPDEQRPAHQTILVERNGQPITQIYNKFGNLLQREQSVIERGLPRTLIEQYRYDRDGNVVSSLSPEGVFTQNLFGRDYFVRLHSLPENDVVPTNELTWKERQAFGRVRATVRRGEYASFDSFTLTQGIWGDFPDILDGTFPVTMLDRSQDIIVKMTYEEEFGQLLTVSDPRYTNSADPDAIEHPRHNETLTKYTYSGPSQLLVKVKYPTIPLLPDGTLGTEIAERFTKPDPIDSNIEIPAYDANGRLQRSINPVGVVTELTYFDEPNELSFGHLRQTVVDPGGLNITVQNEIDNIGRIIAVHLPKSVDSADGRFVTHNVYNDLDQVIETTSTAPFSFQARRFYDRTGKLEREESDLRNEKGQSELGGSTVATFCYDEEFNLVQTTVGGLNLDKHLVTKHGYDSAGKRILTILPNGNQARTRYDERQLPVSQTSGAGSEDVSTTRTQYDGDARIRRSYDALGNSTTFEFDTFGRVISVENALGHITRTNYDKASNVTCVRVFEKRGNGYFLLSRIETDYDELNRATHIAVNRFEDPISFQPNELDDAALDSPGPGELLVTKTVYDENSRLVKIIDPLTRESTSQYDKLDRVIIVTDPLGNETHNQYDDHNNLARTDQRDLVLNDNGDEIGERHFANSSTYDELDRLISSTDSLGNISQLFYDSRGNAVRQVDPLRNESHATFDVFNRPVSSAQFLTESGLGPVTPESVPVITAQEYDLNSNLITVIDASGRRTRYQYDALDRQRATLYLDESQMLTDYDVESNVIRTQDNNGLQRLFTVDALNRTTHVDVDKTQLIGTQNIEGATFERYQYDGLNRLISAENDFAICSNHYNSLSWPLTETIQYTIPEAPIHTPFTITRDFNDVGALIALTYANGRKLELERDKLDRLTTIQNKENGTAYPGNPAAADNRLIAKMNFAGQQPERCLFGNDASTNYRHDGVGRVIEIAYAGVSNPMSSIQYLYDAVSNIRIRNDVFPGGSLTERFAYDSLYRIAHEFKPDSVETFNLASFFPATTQIASLIPDRQTAMTNLSGSLELPLMAKTYDYDLVGNRNIERLENGNDVNYVTNPLDQYESRNGVNFDHDKNGNLINTATNESKDYRYDSMNRLVSVKSANNSELAYFWHDALGRRILERTAGNITQLICDGNNLIAEYRNGNLFAHAQYVYEDGIDQPIQLAAEGKDHWYHSDLVGSVRVLSDALGERAVVYRYSAFGELKVLLGEDVFNLWRYTGRRLDTALGTYDYRAREYDPKVGRFLQRDPLEMIDGTNLYSYVANNPLGYTDPFGTNSRTETYIPTTVSWETATIMRITGVSEYEAELGEVINPIQRYFEQEKRVHDEYVKATLKKLEKSVCVGSSLREKIEQDGWVLPTEVYHRYDGVGVHDNYYLRDSETEASTRFHVGLTGWITGSNQERAWARIAVRSKKPNHPDTKEAIRLGIFHRSTDPTDIAMINSKAYGSLIGSSAYVVARDVFGLDKKKSLIVGNIGANVGEILGSLGQGRVDLHNQNRNASLDQKRPTNSIKVPPKINVNPGKINMPLNAQRGRARVQVDSNGRARIIQEWVPPK